MDAVQSVMNTKRNYGTEDVIFGPKQSFAIIEKNFGSFLIATAIIIAAIIYAYFNPYQSCKRDLANKYYPSVVAHICSGSG